MIGRRGFLHAVGISALGPGRLFAGDATKSKADPAIAAILNPLRDKYHLPGMIGAVVKGNAVSAIGAVGVRKVGSPEPMTVEDVIHLGSCTKAITATLIGTLVDEGKLTWTSTLGEVFPDRAAKLRADVRGLTVTQLLNHRAGLPADPPSWWNLPGKTPSAQRLALFDGPLKGPLASKPGTTFAYSNVGYVVLGMIAERVAGRSWEDLIRDRLFKPLGMTSGGFGPPGTKGKVDQPWGHLLQGKAVTPIRGDNPPVMGPAGTVHCTVSDWAKFVSLHLLAGEGKPKLLKKSTFQVLQTPPKGGDYAGGWIVVDRPWAGGKALTHAGSNTMWYANVWVAPARDFAVLVATNFGGDGAAEVCDEAIGPLMGHHFKSRKPG